MRGRIGNVLEEINMENTPQRKEKYLQWLDSQLPKKGNSKTKPNKATKSVITSFSSGFGSDKPYQPHTLSKQGKPIKKDTHTYNRSKFGSHRDPDYVDLRKSKEKQAKPRAKTTETPGEAGHTILEKSPEKIFAISATSGKQIKGRAELDHIVPLQIIDQKISPPSEYAPDFVKRKWQVRPGGTENLTKAQLMGLHSSEINTQWLSKQENRDKGAKALNQYTKESGWGTKENPQTHKPYRQAESYKNALLDIATRFGKRGMMSRDDAKVYREMTGKEPEEILDANNPEFSPPAHYPMKSSTDFIQKRVQNLPHAQEDIMMNKLPSQPEKKEKKTNRITYAQRMRRQLMGDK